MDHNQALRSQLATAEQVLAWEDSNRPEHELYLAQVEDALSLLDGRQDHGAVWALPQLQSERLLIRAALAKADNARPEAERAAYAATVEDCRRCRATVDAATNADDLIRARAELELADRRGSVARFAFADAADRSRLQSAGMYPLHHALALFRCSNDSEDLARLAPKLPSYQIGYANEAHERAYGCRLTTPEQMVWEVTAETRYPGDVERFAFDVRWMYFGELHNLPREVIDLHTAAE